MDQVARPTAVEPDPDVVALPQLVHADLIAHRPVGRHVVNVGVRHDGGERPAGDGPLLVRNPGYDVQRIGRWNAGSRSPLLGPGVHRVHDCSRVEEELPRIRNVAIGLMENIIGPLTYVVRCAAQLKR